MATKKKTKVGNLISKAVNAGKNVISKVTTAAKNVNLAASVSGAKKKANEPILKAKVGENLTPSQKAKAETVVAPNRQTTSGGLTTAAKNRQTVDNTQYGSSPLDVVKAFSSGGIRKSSGSRSGDDQTLLSSLSFGTNGFNGDLAADGNNLRMSLGGSSAPTNAANVNGSVGKVISPSIKTGITGIGNAVAYNEANKVQTDGTIGQLEKEYQDILTARQEEQKSTLEKIFGKKTPEDAGEDAAREINFDARQNFIQRQAKEKEIETLSLEYNSIKEAMETQIAASYDKLATNNFIDNQQAQIERNAAPKLNRIAADINTKQATIAMLRGDWDDARGFIKDAIAAATAESKYKYDVWTAFNDLNKPSFEAMDAKYKRAINDAYDLIKEERARDVKNAEQVGDLMLKYNHLGAKISLSDSYEEAIAKASRYDPTPSSGGSGSTSDLNQAALSAYISDYRSGKISLSNIPDKYRDAVVSGAATKKQSLPGWNLFTSALRRNFSLVGVTKSQYNEVKSLLEQGYSLDQIRNTNPSEFTNDIYDTFSQYVK